MAKRLLKKMPMRLVALATFGDNPKKIKTGKVSNEPPPARVLMMPATKPTAKRRRMSVING